MPRSRKVITEGTEKEKRAQKKHTPVPSKSSVPSVIKKKSARSSKLTAEVYDIAGRRQGSLALPKELFGQKVNKPLLAQAIRIYFENRSKHYGSVKTRSLVRGGGAKPWRQKGTGRARAGSRRSPLWVGGGITHGPKHRNIQLLLPKKMKRQALVSALSSKASLGQIKIVTNIEKIEPKTKIIANFLTKLGSKGSNLIVVSGKNANVKLATRNIQKTSVDTASNLNAFEVVKNQNVFFSREAIGNLPAHQAGLT